MIVCLACYEDRLASLFENTASFRLFTVTPDQAEPLGELEVPVGDALALGSAMAAKGADTLICGGISGASRRLLAQRGIAVQPWISGTVDEVLDAVGRDTLASLAMPGARCAGTGQGLGRGLGGGGRGMGGGGGQGLGRGMSGGPGRGMGPGGGAGRFMGAGAGRGLGGGGRGSGPAMAQGPAPVPGLGLGPCGLGLRRGPAGRGATPAQGPLSGRGSGLGLGRSGGRRGR